MDVDWRADRRTGLCLEVNAMEHSFIAWTFRPRPGLRPRGLAHELPRETIGSTAEGALRRGVPAIFARRGTFRTSFAIGLPDRSSPLSTLAVTPDWRQRRPRVGASLGTKLGT